MNEEIKPSLFGAAIAHLELAAQELVGGGDPTMQDRARELKLAAQILQGSQGTPGSIRDLIVIVLNHTHSTEFAIKCKADDALSVRYLAKSLLLWWDGVEQAGPKIVCTGYDLAAGGDKTVYVKHPTESNQVSAPRVVYGIVVNARKFTWCVEFIEYIDVCRLAGKDPNTGPSITYYAKTEGDSQRSGTMHPGCKPVKVASGMVFNCVHTGNA